jgi:hypothetical protein
MESEVDGITTCKEILQGGGGGNQSAKDKIPLMFRKPSQLHQISFHNGSRSHHQHTTGNMEMSSFLFQGQIEGKIK